MDMECLSIVCDLAESQRQKNSLKCLSELVSFEQNISLLNITDSRGNSEFVKSKQ